MSWWSLRNGVNTSLINSTFIFIKIKYAPKNIIGSKNDFKAFVKSFF
jgi:hypothetical protein